MSMDVKLWTMIMEKRATREKLGSLFPGSESREDRMRDRRLRKLEAYAFEKVIRPQIDRDAEINYGPKPKRMPFPKDKSTSCNLGHGPNSNVSIGSPLKPLSSHPILGDFKLKPINPPPRWNLRAGRVTEEGNASRTDDTKVSQLASKNVPQNVDVSGDSKTRGYESSLNDPKKPQTEPHSPPNEPHDPINEPQKNPRDPQTTCFPSPSLRVEVELSPSPGRGEEGMQQKENIAEKKKKEKKQKRKKKLAFRLQPIDDPRVSLNEGSIEASISSERGRQHVESGADAMRRRTLDDFSHTDTDVRISDAKKSEGSVLSSHVASFSPSNDDLTEIDSYRRVLTVRYLEAEIKQARARFLRLGASGKSEHTSQLRKEEEEDDGFETFVQIAEALCRATRGLVRQKLEPLLGAKDGEARARGTEREKANLIDPDRDDAVRPARHLIKLAQLCAAKDQGRGGIGIWGVETLLTGVQWVYQRSREASLWAAEIHGESIERKASLYRILLLADNLSGALTALHLVKPRVQELHRSDNKSRSISLGDLAQLSDRLATLSRDLALHRARLLETWERALQEFLADMWKVLLKDKSTLIMSSIPTTVSKHVEAGVSQILSPLERHAQVLDGRVAERVLTLLAGVFVRSYFEHIQAIGMRINRQGAWSLFVDVEHVRRWYSSASEGAAKRSHASCSLDTKGRQGPQKRPAFMAFEEIPGIERARFISLGLVSAEAVALPRSPSHFRTREAQVMPEPQGGSQDRDSASNGGDHKQDLEAKRRWFTDPESDKLDHRTIEKPTTLSLLASLPERIPDMGAWLRLRSNKFSQGWNKR